jgi:hypothetical protein
VSEPIDTRIAALARRHGGHVSRRQLLDLGLSSAVIKYRLATGRLIRVYPGVYAVGHVPVLPLARAAGALLACGPTAALSHGSAATLWGYDKQWHFPFEVTVSRDRRTTGIRVHVSRTLTRRDIRIHLGLRVTSPARTILDFAPGLNDPDLVRIVNQARLSLFLNLDDLAELLERQPRAPGAGRLKQFVVSPEQPSRSWLEDEFTRFCRRFDLPAPRVNVFVGGHEVDAFFEDERVIVELDGYATHIDRATFESDRRRDFVHLLDGIPTVRLTRDRLRSDPHDEADRLHRLLRRRRG